MCKSIHSEASRWRCARGPNRSSGIGQTRQRELSLPGKRQPESASPQVGALAEQIQGDADRPTTEIRAPKFSFTGQLADISGPMNPLRVSGQSLAARAGSKDRTTDGHRRRRSKPKTRRICDHGAPATPEPDRCRQRRPYEAATRRWTSGRNSLTTVSGCQRRRCGDLLARTRSYPGKMPALLLNNAFGEASTQCHSVRSWPLLTSQSTRQTPLLSRHDAGFSWSAGMRGSSGSAWL